MHHLVGRHVLRRPDDLAVHDVTSGTTSGRQLTYRRLWDLAGAVAVRLLALGVRPGDACGIAIDRSADLVIAMLGVARAGACYLPLDTGAPVQRSAAQLLDAGARCLLVTPRPDDRARALVQGLARVGVPSEPDGDPPAESAEPSPEDPLYVSFTSGTSGRPKGVVVPHRAVRHLVEAPAYCDIERATRVGNAANPAFDATTFEIWATLSNGGTVVVLPPVSAVGLDGWLDLLRAARVDALFLTTSLFHVIAHERPTSLAVLRTLLVGGEALAPEAARRVLAAAPPGRLVNVYGPTETTTFATYYDLTLERLHEVERVPIGRAVQRTTLHVLGPSLRPVPQGDRGELCIGGPGVALAYLGQPELTAERFVTVPEVAGGSPLYRTGDVVRQRPGGELEIFGRLDRQVKVRGFRVELEEIERAAVATGLAEVAVVERIGEGASGSLVGFALPSHASAVPAAAVAELLPSRLASVLPDYMVPARWTVLDRLPVGPTGKVDRAALLAASARPRTGGPAAAGSAGRYRPGADPVHRDVQRLWCEVLGVPDARTEDNFIESGGNSILAIQLSSRISEAASVELGPADVLLAADLAELIDAAQRARRTREAEAG
ncbi:MAG: non-ribosomal peptide synthetase [Frankiaceae bacterium]